MTIGCILLAGGQSTRMNGPIEKPFLQVRQKPLFQFSLDLLLKVGLIEEFVCVAKANRHPLLPSRVLKALPGERRQDSVQNGLAKLSPNHELILIHDAARPLITLDDLLKLIEEGKSYAGAALASPVTSTLKRADNQMIITSSQDRNNLWEIHTPQILKRLFLINGLKEAQNQNLTVTDDISFLELLGEKAKLVPISFPNIKVTYPSDLYLVEALLEKLYPVC